MSETIERLLADTAAADRTSIDMESLRRLRSACTEVETGLSYLRRLAQGRLDIVAAEERRRAEGGGPETLHALIERLPSVLAERTRSGGMGRMPQTLDTGVIDAELADELDDIAAPSVMSDPSVIESAKLAQIQEGLAAFEAKVSALRRKFFDEIDALQAEVTRRYRTGEATVDSLLH